MSDKREQFRFMTGTGVAVYPNIHKPSQKYGKFECKLILDPDDETLKEIVKKAEEMRDRFAEEKRKELIAGKKMAKAKAIVLADIVKPEYNDEGEETGMVSLKATADHVGKRKDGSTFTRTITVVDSRNKKLAKVPLIFGGSELKMAGVAFPYYNASNDTVGVSFRLEAVQVIKLVSGGAQHNFGAEEGGYESEDDGEGHDFASGDGESAGRGDDF